MTNKQKEALAFAVMGKAADILEFWTESNPELEAAGITYEEARAQIATWMRRLPGNLWDVRLDGSDGDA